jgi:hypothetical protein
MGAGPDRLETPGTIQATDGFARKLWRLTAAYYSSDEWRSAWAITAAVVGLTLLQIVL